MLVTALSTQKEKYVGDSCRSTGDSGAVAASAGGGSGRGQNGWHSFTGVSEAEPVCSRPDSRDGGARGARDCTEHAVGRGRGHGQPGGRAAVGSDPAGREAVPGAGVGGADQAGA